MELLFFGGRHRNPGETVSWGELFGEWMAHPILTGLMLLCVIWIFIRIYAVWKSRKEEKEEQEYQRELWGEISAEQENEKKPAYEDIYLNIPPSYRVPDGEIPFSERNKTAPKYEWRIFVLLLTLGFVIGIGGSVGGMSDILLLLFVAVLLMVIVIARHLPANWRYTSFDKDGEQKRIINWKGLRKELLPYGAAFAAGLLLGLFRQVFIG